MQFIKSDINLNFIGKRKFAFYFSMALIVISILSLVFHGGPNLGWRGQGEELHGILNPRADHQSV